MKLGSKSWMACIGLAVMAAMVVYTAIVRSKAGQLRAQNEALAAATQEGRQLARENEQLPELRRQMASLDKSNPDNTELLKLRNEVTQLRKQVVDLEPLRAENR